MSSCWVLMRAAGIPITDVLCLSRWGEIVALTPLLHKAFHVLMHGAQKDVL